jgi:hypothetical protein
MNLTTDRAQGVAIVRVGETRLMYPLLADFSGAVMSLLTGVNKRVETMLTMTGAHNFLKMFPDETGALQSFGS